jgi:predicted amidohydrolase
MMLLLGSLHERIPDDPSRVYNTSVLIAANGDVLASYRKLKLFDVALPTLTIKESDSIAPGNAAPPLVDTPIGKLALTICFDLRFSDLYLNLRRRGAEIVFIPSNFTAPTGAAHWEVLIRARAVEGQFYVVAPAQTGKHNPKFTSFGHSMLVDPWGGVVALAPPGPGVIYGDIDLAYLAKVRAELPMGM